MEKNITRRAHPPAGGGVLHTMSEPGGFAQSSPLLKASLQVVKKPVVNLWRPSSLVESATVMGAGISVLSRCIGIQPTRPGMVSSFGHQARGL